MDDTTWISNNQTELQQITTTAETFYKLNNLKPNPNKSTLITTNKSKIQPKTIYLLNQTITSKNTEESIRFSAHGSQPPILNHFKKILYKTK